MHIHSDPEGAEILVDGRLVGTAPLATRVQGRWVYQGARARHTVMARAPGMMSGLYRLEPDEVFVPAAVFCLPFPFFGVGCPWLSQIPDEVSLRLHPVTPVE